MKLALVLFAFIAALTSATFLLDQKLKSGSVYQTMIANGGEHFNGFVRLHVYPFVGTFFVPYCFFFHGPWGLLFHGGWDKGYKRCMAAVLIGQFGKPEY